MKQGTVWKSLGLFRQASQGRLLWGGSLSGCALKDGRVYFEPESASASWAMLLETYPLGRGKAFECSKCGCALNSQSFLQMFPYSVLLAVGDVNQFSSTQNPSPSNHRDLCLSVFPSFHPSVHLFIYLSIHLSIHSSIHLSSFYLYKSDTQKTKHCVWPQRIILCPLYWTVHFFFIQLK